MEPQRIIQRIELGLYEERIGIRMHFTEGPAEVFLFDEATASQLFHQGIALVERLRLARVQQESGCASGVSVGDSAHVRLVQ